jgi:hypothetical protein
VVGGVGVTRENTGAGGRAKIILGAVEIEYIYSSTQPTPEIFTPLNLLEDRLTAV